MKKHDAALERVAGWAREARNARICRDLPSELRRRTLDLWRRSAPNSRNDSLLQFLKWAVAGAVAVMALSILFNAGVLQPVETTPMIGAPQEVFQARTSVTFYVP